jgi:hypothetical protein
MKELIEKVENVVNGNEYAYKVWIEILDAESELKALKEKIREALEKEITNGGAPDNFSISYRKVYSLKGISCWDAKNTEIKNIEKQIKAATVETPFVDATSGELITAAPFTTSTVISYKNKK